MMPYISLALERTPMNEKVGFGGYLGLGALPPVAHGPFATTPVEVTTTIPLALTNGTRQISEWTVSVQSATYGSNISSYRSPFQAVVDSGNWLIIVPPELANEVNAAFSPAPSATDGFEGAPAVACNATPPSFAVEVGGMTFPIDSRDMIWRDASGSCFSSVVPAPPPVDGVSLLFLGDAFLKNVVAVFDMGKNEMRFAARVKVNETAPTTTTSTVPTPTSSFSQSQTNAPATYSGAACKLLPL